MSHYCAIAARAKSIIRETETLRRLCNTEDGLGHPKLFGTDRADPDAIGGIDEVARLARSVRLTVVELRRIATEIEADAQALADVRREGRRADAAVAFAAE